MSTQGTWALWASWFIGETWETVKNLYCPLMFCQKAIEKTQPESGVWGRGEHTAQRRAGSLLVLSWQARWTLEDSGGSCAVGAVATGMKLGAARCLHFHVVWFPRHDGCYLLQCANHFGMCKEGCGQSERCCSREKNTYFINIRTFSWCMCYRKWFWDVLSPGLFFFCCQMHQRSARDTLRASTPLSAEVVSWATPCALWVCSCSGFCWPSTARRGCSGWQKSDGMTRNRGLLKRTPGEKTIRSRLQFVSLSWSKESKVWSRSSMKFAVAVL